MMNDNIDHNWHYHFTIGEWLTRRLDYIYKNQSLDAITDNEGKIINPLIWLSCETGLHLDTIYTLKKCNKYHFGKDLTRQKLAKVLGYYGYPSFYLKDKNKYFLIVEDIYDKLKSEFQSITKTLKETSGRCPFCDRNHNYFLDSKFKNEKKIEKPIFKLFISSHNLKHYGAISNVEKDHFDVEIKICKKCLADNEKAFTMPVSWLLRDLEKKHPRTKFSDSIIADILGIDPPSVNKIKNNKTHLLQKSLVKKIIGLWFLGDLDTKPDIKNSLYAEYIELGTQYALESISFEDLVHYIAPHEKDVLELLEIENNTSDPSKYSFELDSFEWTAFDFDTSGVYLFFSIAYSFVYHGHPMVNYGDVEVGGGGGGSYKLLLVDSKDNDMWEILEVEKL